jgi:hypothetical protein
VQIAADLFELNFQLNVSAAIQEQASALFYLMREANCRRMKERYRVQADALGQFVLFSLRTAK